jgi:hypothetical protein
MNGMHSKILKFCEEFGELGVGDSESVGRTFESRRARLEIQRVAEIL